MLLGNQLLLFPLKSKNNREYVATVADVVATEPVFVIVKALVELSIMVAF